VADLPTWEGCVTALEAAYADASGDTATTPDLHLVEDAR
jgi:hypothetical protein